MLKEQRFKVLNVGKTLQTRQTNRNKNENVAGREIVGVNTKRKAIQLQNLEVIEARTRKLLQPK